MAVADSERNAVGEGGSVFISYILIQQTKAPFPCLKRKTGSAVLLQIFFMFSEIPAL